MSKTLKKSICLFLISKIINLYVRYISEININKKNILTLKRLVLIHKVIIHLLNLFWPMDGKT
jgi:hypothetical protein